MNSVRRAVNAAIEMKRAAQRRAEKMEAELARKDAEIKALDELRIKLEYESFVLGEFADYLVQQGVIGAEQAKTLRQAQAETNAARARLAEVRWEEE